MLCEIQVICAFMSGNFSFALCVVEVSGRGYDRNAVAKIAIGAGVVAGTMIGAGILAYRDRD